MPNHPNIHGARGLTWRRRARGSVAYWQARGDIIARGYPIKVRRLWPPTNSPHPGEPDEGAVSFIRSECERLQIDMLAWAKGGEIDRTPTYTGTIASLINCYRRDPDSPFQKVRYRSRRTYDSHLNSIEVVLGQRALADVAGRDCLRWYTAWADGGHAPRAHARMTMLRILFKFGTMFEYDRRECSRLSEILHLMRFTAGRPRREIITTEQVIAIRAMAHRMGHPSMALAQAIQYETLMRPKDVIGEWVPTSEPGLSDIVDQGRKWLYGLTWREISADLVLTHRLSKSLHGRAAVADPEAGKTKRFDLHLYPMVMEELNERERLGSVGASVDNLRILTGDRHSWPRDIRGVGPLIVSETTGLPYSDCIYRSLWRRIATAAGVPAHVQNRDSRAGGATEGEAATGDRTLVQRAAGHAKVDTTAIYVRNEDEATAKVARLRAKHRDGGK